MASAEKFLPKKLRTRAIEAAIPRSVLEDLVAAHLYAISYVNDDEDILSIDFPMVIPAKGAVAITFTLKKKARTTKNEKG